MFDLIFKNVIPADAADGDATDVCVKDGLISSIGRHDSAGLARVVDGSGMFLLPGAIDMHVHLREPGACHKEDIASGTRAAVLSGVTTLADMPNNTPPVTTGQAFLAKAALADRSECCDVKLYMALTADNIPEIRSVLGHPRFAGIKVFLGATTGNMLCSIDSVIRAAEALDCLFVFHAESAVVLDRVKSEFGTGQTASDHLRLRPVEAAVDAVRDIVRAHRPGWRFHICHASTIAELELIRDHDGITCEAAPHHMALEAGDTDRLGNLGKMNPPLRDESDRAGVLQALVNGYIDCVATDHAPHTLTEKSQPYPTAPAGVPGVETLVPWVLSLVQSDTITLADACRVLSANPARLLGLSDRGRIREGLRADLVLWNPSSTWTVSDSDIRSKCGWSPFSGMRLAGRPVVVCRKGELVS